MKVLPRRRRTVLLNCLLAAALATGAGVAYATVGESGGNGKSSTARTATVQRGTVTATVSGSGSLVSPSDAALSFTTGGTLTEVDVKAGDHVTAGEVLAKVDPTSAKQTLEQAEAQLTSAEANLTAVEDGESSNNNQSGGGQNGSQNGGSQNGGTGQGGQSGTTGGSSTGGTGAGSGGGSSARPSTQPSAQPSASASPSSSPSSSAGASPRPSASATATATPSATRSAHAVNAAWVQAASASPSVDAAQLAQAQAQLVSAQNSVTAAQKAVNGTVLKATVSGTVASVGGKVGDAVSGSSGSGSGSGSGGGSSSGSSSSSSSLSGFVVITNPSGMQVTADFSESDALKLKSGQAASVTLNADTSKVLDAKLVSISSLPVSSSSGGGGGSSSSAVQYAATLQITGDTADLRTGLSASVQVTTGEADDALWVPTSAVTGTGANATVTVVDANGATHRQQVSTGVQGDTEVQIVSGLTEGQRVQLTVVASTGNNGFPAGGFPGLGGGGFGGQRVRSGGAGGGGRG